MPPSSQRRTRTRKRIESAEKSDAEDNASLATPTRKKRRINNGTPRQTEVIKSAPLVKVDSQRRKTRASDAKPPEEEEMPNQAAVDSFIRNLRTAKYEIQARIDYANEMHEAAHPEGKQAYAKIAGNGWTYYVDQLEVRIGRPPEERQVDTSALTGMNNLTSEKALVHIDLGPSKLVSRQHAEIRFNDTDGQWYITVNGRNGVRLDDELLPSGKSEYLHSGSVIDVAGTQMMFVTPNELPTIHPSIQAKIGAHKDGNGQDDEDDNDDDDVDPLPPPPRPQRTPTRGPPSTSGPARQSTAKDHSSKAAYGQTGHVQYTNSSMPVMHTDGTVDTRHPGSQSAQKTSPSFSRGLMLESTDDIDYASDSAKDLKPPHSYAQLIGMAILSSPEEKLTLSKIYDWIKERYAFYRLNGGGWQNSIRHNLSLNKCFEKIARRTDEPGKGMKWQIVPEHREEFMKKGLSVRKSTGHGSTGPNSPMYNNLSSMDPDRRFDNAYARDFQESRTGNPFVKTSPASTPPIGAYPQTKLAYTPERGGSGFAKLNGMEPSSPRHHNGISPIHYGKHRLSGLTELAAASTPGGLPMLGGSESNDILYTPLVSRQAPKLAPPSTARLPSHFMPLSSPAPFWKYAAEFGSTPAGLYDNKLNLDLDMSPTKSIKSIKAQSEVAEEDRKAKIEVKADDKAIASVGSSSPPPAEGEVGQESPTKGLGNRGRDIIQIKKKSISLSPRHYTQLKAQPHTANSTFASQPRSVVPSTVQDEEEDDEEEEGIIDLARGFQPIGSFHRNMNANVIRG